MISESTNKIRKFIIKLMLNIRDKEVPPTINGKRVVPAQKKKIEEIKKAQMEALREVTTYIDKYIHV